MSSKFSRLTNESFYVFFHYHICLSIMKFMFMNTVIISVHVFVLAWLLFLLKLQFEIIHLNF